MSAKPAPVVLTDPALSDTEREAILARLMAISAAQETLKAESDRLRKLVSNAAFEHYSNTGDKTYAPGVNVRETVNVTFDPTKTRDWVMSDPYGRSKYLTVNTDNAPVLVGFLLSNPMFHGMLTVDKKELESDLRETFRKGEKVEGLPYDELSVTLSKSLQLAITEKDLGITAAEYPAVVLKEYQPE